MAKISTVIVEDVRSVAAQMADNLSVLAGKTVLVTGACGFLPSYFVDLFVALNETGLAGPCRVIAADNFVSGVPDRLQHLAARADVQILTADLSKPFTVDEQPHYIIHGASIASPVFYRRYPLETIAVNVDGTRNLLELARRGTRSFLYLSSSEIYGDPEPNAIPTPETYRGSVSCVGPRACYDESKRLAETLCFSYHRLFGLPVKVVRPFNVYGPGQRLDDGRIIPDLISRALRQQPLVLYSNGRATRAFCYIRDAIRAMLLVLLSDADGEAFNVGNDTEETPISRVADVMCQVSGPGMAVEYHISADSDFLTDNPNRRLPDLTKLRKLGPWKPEVDIREGLTRTLRSYQDSDGPFYTAPVTNGAIR